jgi:hypothetical protein
MTNTDVIGVRRHVGGGIVELSGDDWQLIPKPQLELEHLVTVFAPKHVRERERERREI